MLAALDRFLFPVKFPYALARLRIGVSAVLLIQAAMIGSSYADFWGPKGYLQGSLNQFFVSPTVPFLLDLNLAASVLGVSLSAFVAGIFALYLVALVMLLVGFRTRLSAFLVLTTHLLLKFNQGYLSGYGVDTFAQAFLFYIAIFPSGEALSVDSIGRPPRATQWYGFSLRVMQIHLSIAYFSSGVCKSLGWQWRTGEIMYRALNLPQFQVFDMTWLAHYAWLTALIAWGTLFIEIGYPVLLGWKRSRVFAALAIIGMHVGIMIFMGLWTFGMMMIVLTGSIFLIPDSQRGLFAAAPVLRARPYVPFSSRAEFQN